MKWEKMKLSSCCFSIADGDHQPPPKSETGVPFVTISNITSTNKFDFSNTMFVPHSYYEKLDEKRKAMPNDVLYSVVGSFGIPVFVDEEKLFVFQRHIAILKANSQVLLPKFLYYTMLSHNFYIQADAVAIGAAQRTISLSALRNMYIYVPRIDIQERIVNILSAYDNLIENNQKQIKLLEEAAQRLYKEWFVDLRFPGYENVPVVDSMPEGWERGKIADVVEYHDKIRKPLSSQERLSFKGDYKYYGAAGVLDHVKEYLFDGTYLLFGEDGTVITTNGNPVLQYVSGKFWVNNHAHVLTGKEPFTTEFIYMMFHEMKVTDVVTGVAQPKISQARLSNKGIILPTRKLIEEFQDKTEAIFKMTLALQKQVEQATEARDRLLSKLMSGELEV